jgi:hypothetical protein
LAGETVLFQGPIGTQRVRVWLEPTETGISLQSHDIGPALERIFGDTEIETYLNIDGEQLPRLASALKTDATPAAVIEALAIRYRDHSAATTELRGWLDELGIPYRFNIV